jgi:hypothetical protein
VSHYLVFGACVFCVGWLMLRRCVVEWQENQRDRKAGVETLFSGRK